MTTIVSRYFLRDRDLCFLGSTAKPTSVRACLLSVADLSTLSDTSPMAALLANELPQISGYTRADLGTSGPNSNAYDSGLAAWLSSWVRSFSASGAALTYNAGLILYNASATANKIATALNTSTSRLTVSAHGLTDGSPVGLTVDPGGTYPSNSQSVTSATQLYAKSIDANTIELYLEAALTTKANFSSAGSGTLRVRYCQGQWALLTTAANPGTVPDGASREIEFKTYSKGL